MKSINHLKQYKFALLFISIIFLYFFLYGFKGYDDADSGYTLALSGRILNGEIAYRDFILVRPPFSPYLHALLLYLIPDNDKIIFDRFLFYIEIAAAGLFATFSIGKVFNLQKLGINPYLLASAGFVFSVHNIPAMAWHTIDGVFLGSIGIFIITTFLSLPTVALGMIFLFLSALCKQPFYLMPVAGIIYVSIIYKNWLKILVSVIALFIGVVLFFYILYKFTILKSFISLSTGSTTLKDLIYAGFTTYFKFNLLYLVLPFAMWYVVQKFQHNTNKKSKIKLIPYFFISVVLLLPWAKFLWLFIFKNNFSGIHFRETAGCVLLIITISFLLLDMRIDKKWITLLFLTILSWCSGISWGHLSPAFFSVPLIFGFLLMANNYFNTQNLGRLTGYLLVLGFFTYLFAFQQSYGNPFKNRVAYSVSDLFPKLKYIKVNEDTYKKYHEFFNLVNKYGPNFKTLPGMPLSNYITNTNSPIKLDWVFNAETGTYNNEIISTLQNKNSVIFIEKTPVFIGVSDSQGKFNSLVTYFIKTHWEKIDSTYYFEIYKFKQLRIP